MSKVIEFLIASSIEMQISPTDSKDGFPGKVITSVELGSAKNESCSSFIDASSMKVIDKVIPNSKILPIRNEIVVAQKKISKNISTIKELLNSKKIRENE